MTEILETLSVCCWMSSPRAKHVLLNSYLAVNFLVKIELVSIRCIIFLSKKKLLPCLNFQKSNNIVENVWNTPPQPALQQRSAKANAVSGQRYLVI